MKKNNDLLIEQIQRSQKLTECLQSILFNIQINNMDSFLKNNIITNIESVLTEKEIEEVNARF